MLSHGQAACLVLDKKATHANQQEAKTFFAGSPLAVVYLADGNPLEPMIMAESIVLKNPYRYKRYPPVLPETPLASPVLPTIASENEMIDYQDSASSSYKPSTAAKKSHSNTTTTITIPAGILNSDRSSAINTIAINSKSTKSTKPTKSTRIKKSDVIHYLKSTYRATKPANSNDYDSRFLTNTDLYQELKTRYPHIENQHSLRRICLWLHKEMDTFGPLKARRLGGLVKKGRVLWKPRQTTL